MPGRIPLPFVHYLDFFLLIGLIIDGVFNIVLYFLHNFLQLLGGCFEERVLGQYLLRVDDPTA